MVAWQQHKVVWLQRYGSGLAARGKAFSQTCGFRWDEMDTMRAAQSRSTGESSGDPGGDTSRAASRDVARISF